VCRVEIVARRAASFQPKSGRTGLGQHECRQPRTEDGNSDDRYAEADNGYQIFALGHWRPLCFEGHSFSAASFPYDSREGENGFVLSGGAGHAGGFFLWLAHSVLHRRPLLGRTELSWGSGF
jgi:hypothetical protein